MFRGVRIAGVTAVLTNLDGAPVGFEVATALGRMPRFLPAPAASARADGLEASPLALLAVEQARFYVGHGARRVDAADDASTARAPRG
jgi:hypothetical protein